MNVKITGIGSYIPSEVAKNEHFGDHHFYNEDGTRFGNENTVIIEDSLNGVQSGLASGAFVIAKTGSVPDSQLSIAHRIISHLDEITHKMIVSWYLLNFTEKIYNSVDKINVTFWKIFGENIVTIF